VWWTNKEILLKDAILLLKNNKAPEEDQIQAELIKEAADLGAQVMHKLCNTIWRTMKWPKQSTQVICILLPKTGDLKECKNYRTISLLSHTSKVLLIIILNKLKNKSEMELPNEQTGFRPGRGSRDLLVNIQTLIEKVNATQNSVFFLCL